MPKNNRQVKMKKRLISLLCLLLFVFCPVVAYADEPPLPPTPWYMDLGDGLVFHYRPEYENYSPHVFVWGTPTEFEAQGYPQTGLYLNGELIYTVEVPIRRSLYFSSDGMSFLEVRSGVSTDGDMGIDTQYRFPIEPAVRFFEQGNLIHYYEVFDLVADPNSLLHSESFAQWDYQNERYHDQDNNTLRVRTRDGRDIIFDLSTGLILSNKRDFNPLILWASVTIAVLAVGFRL